jgi:dihydroxyacid dehydratase/phosphogluconate dehydratase
MLHLRDLGLLHLDAMTVTGQTVGENLDWWQTSERRENSASACANRTASIRMM